MIGLGIVRVTYPDGKWGKPDETVDMLMPEEVAAWRFVRFPGDINRYLQIRTVSGEQHLVLKKWNKGVFARGLLPSPLKAKKSEWRTETFQNELNGYTREEVDYYCTAWVEGHPAYYKERLQHA